MQMSHCRQCDKPLTSRGRVVKVYCNIKCKSEWQRTSDNWSNCCKSYANYKPLDKDLLYQKYIIEHKSTYKVAEEMGCNQTRVVDWLKRYGIKARPKGKSYHKGYKHSEKTKQKMREIALKDGRVPFDPKVGSYMKGRKGADCPNWKGGCTAERQLFYSSKEWLSVSRKAKIRDAYKCRNCGKLKLENEHLSFDLHHIVPFACKELRADIDNLVYLCEPCH